MQFITQPFGEVRLGEFLLNHFADPQWTAFRAAVAFVKRSGTQHLRQALRDFSARAEVRISVGVDLYGTSTEGLRDLVEATREGQVLVYRNNGPYTFHPKVYLFKSAQHADVLVGSGNMTGGGLFTNYEASLAASLDLNVPEDRAFLDVIEATLNTWSQPQQGTCYVLTAAFIDQLVAAGIVRSEIELAAMQPRPPAAGAPTGRQGEGGEAGAGAGEPAPPPLFVAVAVPQAPRIAREAVEAAEAEAPAEAAELPSATVVPPPGIVPVQTGGVSCFVMTLQNTDVGVGQTTRGTSRRSPEVFIPLAAIDQNTAFWTFPNQFTADRAWNARNPRKRRNGLGKMDRAHVPMRIGTVQAVSMFFNPDKGDFRLRNEVLRSSGHVGDILFIRRVDPVNGFEYDVQVAPQGSPLFAQLEPFCNTQVPHSQKRFGYF